MRIRSIVHETSAVPSAATSLTAQLRSIVWVNVVSSCWPGTFSVVTVFCSIAYRNVSPGLNFQRRVAAPTFAGPAVTVSTTRPSRTRRIAEYRIFNITRPSPGGATPTERPPAERPTRPRRAVENATPVAYPRRARIHQTRASPATEGQSASRSRGIVRWSIRKRGIGRDRTEEPGSDGSAAEGMQLGDVGHLQRTLPDAVLADDVELERLGLRELGLAEDEEDVVGADGLPVPRRPRSCRRGCPPSGSRRGRPRCRGRRPGRTGRLGVSATRRRRTRASPGWSSGRASARPARRRRRPCGAGASAPGRGPGPSPSVGS